MKKINNTVYILLLMLILSGCDDKVKTLELRVSELESELAKVQTERNEQEKELKSNTEFEKEMQCQEMLDRLKRRWNNIVGCYYSSYYNTCMVKYMKNGVVNESKIEDMTDD